MQRILSSSAENIKVLKLNFEKVDFNSSIQTTNTFSILQILLFKFLLVFFQLEFKFQPSDDPQGRCILAGLLCMELSTVCRRWHNTKYCVVQCTSKYLGASFPV